MGRFDPIEGADYGNCVTCGAVFVTRDDADKHRTETMDESPIRRSHTTRGLNRTREERIQSWADDIVQDAISDAIDNLRDEVASANVSWDEVFEALRWHSDFADEWEKQS